MKQSSNKPSPKEKLSDALQGAKGIITPSMVAKNLGVSQQEGGRLLSRWAKSGWIERVRRGIYRPLAVDVLPDEIAIEDPLSIINKVYGPGYLASFSAIKYWDLSEQIFESKVFFTEKKVQVREVDIGGTKVILKTILPRKNFGTKTFWQDGLKLKVSDPTKTIADLLDDPKIGGGMRVVSDFFKQYSKSEYYEPETLIKYLSKNGNKSAFKRLGFLLETLNLCEESFLDRIQENISSGYSEFDSSVKNSKIVKKWNLKVPTSWKKEYDRKK